MRIAIVIPELHKGGGTERCVASMAEALEPRGHSFVVFSSRKDPSVLPSARWYRVPMFPRPHLLRFLSFFCLNPLVRLAAWLRGERVDVVLSTGPDVLHPDVAVFHCCARSVLRAFDQQAESDAAVRFSRLRVWMNRLTYFIVARLEAYVVRSGARNVVAISRALRSDLVASYGAPGARIAVVPNGVNVCEFRRATPDTRRDARVKLAIPEGSRVAAFVGHAWERKGLNTLLTAGEQLREWRPELPLYLLVVGGNRNAEYEGAARRRLRGQCLFLGRRSDLPAIYAAADVCVLPSLLESFGLPILEAMACGVPGIVSAEAGVAEIIADGEDGLLLQNPRDPAELAAKLLCLVSDRERFRSMGLRARATAEKYSWDGLARQFEHICERSADSDLITAA